MRQIFLSTFGAGHLKPASGTWGSLAALPLGWVVYQIGGPFLFLAAIVAVTLLGIRAIDAEMRETGVRDPSWIVADEVAGQWIALLPVAFGAWRAEVPVTALWPGIVAAFLFFRLFDIWKPWLVGRADARDDAAGVMLDDVWAGLFAAIVVIVLAVAAHAGFVASVNPADP